MEKICLLLLPFWDPQIPPLGIACLKSYLQKHGYVVTTADANLDVEFRQIHDDYFTLLKENIPPDKQGNLFNIGDQVLRNHLMAYLNYTDEGKYTRLVNILVHNTFYHDVGEACIIALNRVVAGFYQRLQEYVLDRLDNEKPGILGLSVYSGNLAAAVFTFKLAKERVPGIRTLMGGGIFADQLAPGSPDLDFFIEKTGDYIDKIIIGEGEQLFLDVVSGRLDETQKVFSIKDQEGRNLDMTIVDIPDFSDFELSHYPHLAYYASRSCPFQCRFCSETVIWGKYRKKPMAQVVREMRQLSEKYHYQLFLMTDSLLNPIVSDLANEIIASGASLYWDGFLRADKRAADIENTLLWRRGGFYRAKMGLESGSPRVLELMRKKITVPQIKEALASLAYAGIKTTTFWLFGFPGETEEDFQMTLDLLEEVKDNIYEADCNAFNYYLTGQVNSEEWLKDKKDVLLYPSWAKEMLIFQTRCLDCEPSREEAYKRVNRFAAHCKRLGIPNPYSLSEIYQADERWKNLHVNAVPALVEFENREGCIDEARKVKKLSMARTILQDDEEWL